MANKEPKPAKTPQAPQAAGSFDWSQHQGAGLENVQKEDLGIPFLLILQKGSPQVDKDHQDYPTKKIPQAEIGDIINSLSNEVIYTEGDAPLEFIPCFYHKSYMEWKARNSGGGLVKSHADAQILTECTRNEMGQDILRNGNIIVTTAYFYGILLYEGEKLPCVISLSSTQLKKSRQWLTIMMNIRMKSPSGQMYQPPMFSHKYLLSTVPEKNEKGTWRGWKIERGPEVQDPGLIAESILVQKRSSALQHTTTPPKSLDQGDNVM